MEERKCSQLLLIRIKNWSEVCYIYMLTFSNFKTWLNMASSLHAVAVVHRAREKKGNIHTWQTISNNSCVWGEREDGTKLNFFFFFFSLIKNTTFCWKRWRDSREARVRTFFFLTTLSNHSFIHSVLLIKWEKTGL